MANSTTTNPIVCDTAGVLTTHATMRLKAIAWVSDAASGKDIAADDDMVLLDNDSNRIISKRAEAATDGLVFNFPDNFKVAGLNMATITGGVCYLYV